MNQRVDLVFYGIFALLGLDLCPGTLKTHHRLVYKTVYRSLVHFGLLMTVIQTGSHLTGVPLTFQRAIARNDVFVTALSLIRHLSLKVIALIILWMLWKRRREINELIEDVRQLYVAGHSRVTLERARLPGVLLMWFVMSVQTFIYLIAYWWQFGFEPDMPPKMIPRLYGNMAPLWVQIILCTLDTYTYTMYVYGGRLALATVVAIIGYALKRELIKMNAILEEMTATAAGGQPTRDSAGNVLQKVALVRDLHERMTQLFSWPIFLSIALDFLVAVIDIFSMSDNLNRPFSVNVLLNHLNQLLAWLPILVTSASGARLSSASARLESNLRQTADGSTT